MDKTLHGKIVVITGASSGTALVRVTDVVRVEQEPDDVDINEILLRPTRREM